MDELLSKINQLKKQIDVLRPLNKGELQELKKWYETTYTYHTNALEGNSLTLAETKIVLEEGLTIEGKPLRDILEATNHKEALDLLFSLVEKKTKLTEECILGLHKIFLDKIDTENAGVYRKIQVYISGEEEKLPSAHEVPFLMQNLLQWYGENSELLHPTILSAEFHYRFVKIHPFVDGNGRIARLISNLILLQSGYPLVIIPTVQRREYITALKSTSTKESFVNFFLASVVDNMRDYMRMIDNTKN